MTLPEAIVYLLASSGYGMKTEQIAREINARRLHVRKDGGGGDGEAGVCRGDGAPGNLLQVGRKDQAVNIIIGFLIL